MGRKDGRWVRLTTLTHSCAACLEILGAPVSWSPKGLARTVEIALPPQSGNLRYVLY